MATNYTVPTAPNVQLNPSTDYPGEYHLSQQADTHATPYDLYSLYGLNSASGLLSQNAANGFQYPDYVSAAQNAPTKENYFGYTPTAPMAQVSTPDYNFSGGNYQGLMGGDYDKLQTALTQPGELAAKTAYDQGYLNLNDTMGGRGLYGSSIMANQANQGLDTTYQNAMASNAANAAAQRYGLQQTDLQNLNQYNLSREQELNKYNMQGTDLQRQQNADLWKSGATEADRLMQYGQGQMNYNQSYADQMRNWQNQQQYEKYTYDLAKQAEQKAYQENLMNQSLAIAGQGAPLANAASAANTAAQNRNLQAQIAQNQASVASQNGWLGAAGALGGGLLGNSSVQNLIGEGINNLVV
jgi:hypothetical protein